MKGNSKHKSLDNIEKAILEGYLNDPKLAREELEAAGIDVDSLVAKGLDMVNQFKFQHKVEKNKSTLLPLFNRAKELLIAKILVNRNDALLLLSSMQSNVQYRNLDHFSDEELNEVLKDLDLIKLIEELEKK